MRRRVLNYLTYVALSVPVSLFVRCDVVLGMTDPPFEGIVAAVVALAEGQTAGVHVRDLYPDMAMGGSIVEPGLLTKVWERLHRWALRRATRVVVLGDDMRARIVAKGVRPERVSVVRDGAEICAAGSQPTVDLDVVRAIRSDFKFVLLHAGNLGFYGAWETLVAAARELADEGVGLVFVGTARNGGRSKRRRLAAQTCDFWHFFRRARFHRCWLRGCPHSYDQARIGRSNCSEQDVRNCRSGETNRGGVESANGCGQDRRRTRLRRFGRSG